LKVRARAKYFKAIAWHGLREIFFAPGGCGTLLALRQASRRW
jgi:hypothetical protein